MQLKWNFPKTCYIINSNYIKYYVCVLRESLIDIEINYKSFKLSDLEKFELKFLECYKTCPIDSCIFFSHDK